MLLNYEEYQEMGGKLDEIKFSFYETLAECDLKSIANGVLPDTPIVNACMFMMINAYDTADNMPLESRAKQFSNDGVQVTLSNDQTPESILDTAIGRVKKMFENAGIYSFLGVKHRE